MAIEVLQKIGFLLTEATEKNISYSMGLIYLSSQYQLWCHKDLMKVIAFLNLYQ